MSRARKNLNLNKEPDPELGAELRQTAGREWADEAAEDERLTELLRRRRLELAEVVKDVAHRGTRVLAEFGGHSFTGAVIRTGVDYASLDDDDQVADIRYETATWSVLGSGPPAEPGIREPESFRALLHEYSATSNAIRLALPEGKLAHGSIAVVSVDHIEVDDIDERQIYVPTAMILAVIRSTELH